MADVTRQVKWLDLWCEMARCHVVITVGMREEATLPWEERYPQSLAETKHCIETALVAVEEK